MRPPVATTTAVAVPLATLVPIRQILESSSSAFSLDTSPSLDFCATLPIASYFSMGIASPVKIAWLMNRSREAIRRTSAGTMSPAES